MIPAEVCYETHLKLRKFLVLAILLSLQGSSYMQLAFRKNIFQTSSELMLKS